MKTNGTFTAALAAIAIGFAVAGCGDGGVKEYKVSSADSGLVPPAPTATAPVGMQGDIPEPDLTGQPTLKWKTPEGWQSKPLTSLRLASFSVVKGDATADVSVVAMNGASGGEPANVNRWRGQVGLPNVSDEEIAKLAEKVEVAGASANLYDVASPAGSDDEKRILGVILYRDDMAWFFKMNGASALVAEQKAAFLSFLKSCEFTAPQELPPARDMNALPPSHPPIGGMPSSTPK